MASTTNFSLESMYDLRGRIALVTGGGTGIGWMIAQAFATNGATVYITGRRKDVLEKAAASFETKESGGKVIPVMMDVTNRESIAIAQIEIQKKAGKLHILVNNAGQVGPYSLFFNDLNAPEHQSAETLGQAMFSNESFEEWGQLYTINTFSIYFVTMAFLGLLAKGSDDNPDYTSCVINITSISGLGRTAQKHFAYNSSKAAASHLTKMLSTEFALKKLPVRVCGIAPGVFESELTVDLLKDSSIDKILDGVVPLPAQRPGKASEMAGTAMYLASPAGAYMNGHEVIVDGGALATSP